MSNARCTRNFITLAAAVNDMASAIEELIADTENELDAATENEESTDDIESRLDDYRSALDELDGYDLEELQSFLGIDSAELVAGGTP